MSACYRFDSYEAYPRAQILASRRKASRQWVSAAEVAFLAMLIRERIPRPSFGICHGVRTGFEVDAFRRERPGVGVIGTDIAAIDHPHVLPWDFHEAKPEWIDRFDFLYSNSLDHAHDPERAVSAWLSSLAPGGIVPGALEPK